MCHHRRLLSRAASRTQPRTSIAAPLPPPPSRLLPIRSPRSQQQRSRKRVPQSRHSRQILFTNRSTSRRTRSHCQMSLSLKHLTIAHQPLPPASSTNHWHLQAVAMSHRNLNLLLLFAPSQPLRTRAELQPSLRHRLASSPRCSPSSRHRPQPQRLMPHRNRTSKHRSRIDSSPTRRASSIRAFVVALAN